jgi:hypothetical protein
LENTPSSEFIFIRDKLEKIARLIVDGEPTNLREAAFMIGCLHNVCHQNVLIFQECKCKADLH